MTKTHIVGFCGAKQSGKSTGCDCLSLFLTETAALNKRILNKGGLEGNVVVEALARPLKEALSVFFDKERDHFASFSDDEKESVKLYNGVSPRVAMQKFGTEFCRTVFGDDIHADLLIKRIDKKRAFGEPANAVALIQDIRFDNEVVKLKEHFGDDYVRIVKVERDASVNGDTHASEKGVSPELVDVVITNNGGLLEYRDKLAHYFTETFGGREEFKFLA